MAFFKENTHIDGTKSTDWGGSIAGGFGGMGGFAFIIGLFFGAIVAGGFALLWFAMTGYKRFNLGGLSRVFALVLSIIYAYIVYTTFASGKPDLMILVYANIPIAIFFVVAYIYLKRDSKYVKGTVNIAKATADSQAVAVAGKGLKKLLYITKLIFLYVVLPLSIFTGSFMYSLKVSEPTFLKKHYKSLEYTKISKSLNKNNFKEVFANNISKKEKLIDEYSSLFAIRVLNILGKEYRGSYIITIEGFIALDKKLKEEGSRAILTNRTLENIIDNLGRLDKGYSKKLAELIRNNSNPELFNSYSDKRIETKLKKYNQISALKEFKIKQSQYNYSTI